MEEKNSIQEICENYGDIFFIEGDKLSHNQNHKHKIILNENIPFKH